MASLQELLQALRDQNIAAFLRVIRQGESSQDDAIAFHMLVYGGRFESFDDHPRKHFDRTTHQYVENWRAAPSNSTTSAAGAFQITETSWNRFCAATGYAGRFDETGQSLYVPWSMLQHGVLDDVLAGRLDDAIKGLRGEWTSLPGAAENHSKWNLEAARALFRRYGGVLEGDAAPSPAAAPGVDPQTTEQPAPASPASTTEDSSVDTNGSSTLGSINSVIGAAAPIAGAFNPAIGLGLGLLNSLLSVFQPLVREKVAKEVNRHTDDPTVGKAIADGLINKAIELTGKSDPVEAIAAAKNNAAIVQQLETTALETLERLAPFLDKLHAYSKDEWAADEASRAAAAARYQGAAFDPAPMIVNRLFWLLVGLLIATGALIGIQMWFADDHKPAGELVGLFIGLATLVGQKISTIVDNRFGSSASSAAKDATIQQLARVQR